MLLYSIVRFPVLSCFFKKSKTWALYLFKINLLPLFPYSISAYYSLYFFTKMLYLALQLQQICCSFFARTHLSFRSYCIEYHIFPKYIF